MPLLSCLWNWKKKISFFHLFDQRPSVEIHFWKPCCCFLACFIQVLPTFPRWLEGNASILSTVDNKKSFKFYLLCVFIELLNASVHVYSAGEYSTLCLTSIFRQPVITSSWTSPWPSPPPLSYGVSSHSKMDTLLPVNCHACERWQDGRWTIFSNAGMLAIRSCMDR